MYMQERIITDNIKRGMPLDGLTQMRLGDLTSCNHLIGARPERLFTKQLFPLPLSFLRKTVSYVRVRVYVQDQALM